MLFHAKALEVFTLAYQSIQNIDEEEDLEVSCGYSIYSPCWVLDEPDFCWTSYLGAPITHPLIAHSPHPLTDLVTLKWFTLNSKLFRLTVPSFFCSQFGFWSLRIYFWSGRRQNKQSAIHKRKAPPADALVPISSTPLPFHLRVCVLFWIISLSFTLKWNSSRARAVFFSVTHITKHGSLNHLKQAQWQAWR